MSGLHHLRGREHRVGGPLGCDHEAEEDSAQHFSSQPVASISLSNLATRRRSSGCIVSVSMMSAQSSLRSSRWRMRREEIASRSACSRLRTLRRCPRADGSRVWSRSRRAALPFESIRLASEPAFEDDGHALVSDRLVERHALGASKEGVEDHDTRAASAQPLLRGLHQSLSDPAATVVREDAERVHLSPNISQFGNRLEPS